MLLVNFYSQMTRPVTALEDSQVRLEMAELLGNVVGDRGEGVGGKTVKVLNSRGEYFQPKILKQIFHQQ